MRSKLPNWAILVASLAATAAVAHHSPAMLYDLSQEIVVEGVVTKYELGNPHLRVYFDVQTDEGTVQWMAEGGSRTVLVRKGWDGSEVSPGDHISIKGHPTRDGSNIVHLEYLTLPDGRELYGEDLNQGALEDLRRRRQE